MLLCLWCKRTPASQPTCVCVDCKTVEYANGIPLCNDCKDDHLTILKGHSCISMCDFKSQLALLHRVGNVSCDKHADEHLKMFCRGCSKVLCSVCAINEHHFHNVILLRDAAEAERTDVSELCAEASISEEEIQAELHKLEQKIRESADHSSTLHLNIDQEADALISRIHVCRQKAHEDVEEKMSSLIRALEEQRVSLEEMMSRSKESRVQLVRALEEASDVSIFEHTREAKRQLISVLEEDVRKEDSMVEEEVFVSVARAAVDLGKVDEMFEVRSRRVGLDRAVVLLSRGAGMIGQGLLDVVVGSTDIWIPPGGSVTDALLFVPDWNTGC